MSVAPAGLGENSPPPSVQPADAGISVAPATRAENGPLPAAQPTFYQDLAQADAMVDATAAQSMISGYRKYNRLEPLAVDSELMRIASEQARAMAARNAMDHDVGRSFQERMRKSGFRRECRDRERRGRLPHARRCVFRLARFAAASRQYAQSQRDPHGNRRGLCADLQIQGILGAYPRRPCGPSRLSAHPERGASLNGEIAMSSLVSQFSPVGRCSTANSTGSNDALRRRSGFCAHSGFAVSGASNEFVIVVPAGFVTDFAGTPRALWSVIPRPDAGGRGPRFSVLGPGLNARAGRRNLPRGDGRKQREALRSRSNVGLCVTSGSRLGTTMQRRKKRESRVSSRPPI